MLDTGQRPRSRWPVQTLDQHKACSVGSRDGPLSDYRAGPRGSCGTRLIRLSPPPILPATVRSGEHAPSNCRDFGDLIRRKRCNLYNQFISRGPRRGTLRGLQKEPRRFMDAGGHPHRGGCPHSGRHQFQEHGREPHHREEMRQVTGIGLGRVTQEHSGEGLRCCIWQVTLPRNRLAGVLFMIEGIRAVTLGTHEIPRAVRFYCALGFEVLRGNEQS